MKVGTGGEGRGRTCRGSGRAANDRCRTRQTAGLRKVAYVGDDPHQRRCILRHRAVRRQAAAIHILPRGDVTKPGKEVGPGAIAAIPGLTRLSIYLPTTPKGDRRAALARWLTDPNNPLTWRVMVNRVWQYHFGRGLVDTPNDFGKMGQLPTHPELLDWLAAEFRDDINRSRSSTS